jgi:glycosyltransferase involved in cell wall biosynthesis
VVIAFHNAGNFLEQSLQSISSSNHPPHELILVDDGSTDGSAEIAEAVGAAVIRTLAKGGPARARNAGARAATGELLLFIDSDVCVHPETIGLIQESLLPDQPLDAVIGSYDDEPGSPAFLSQYRNLMHCFVHRTGSREAFTFWSGCGGIRRKVFLEFGGFDERYARPSIEDIEFGYRLIAGGKRIGLRPGIEVKHLKRWTLWQMIRTDVMDRGIPWTELILRHERMPNDLNLRIHQRLSVILVYALLGVSITGYFAYAGLILLLLAIALNLEFYRFLAVRRGYLFAIAAIPFHLLYHFYNGISFGVGLFRWGVSRAHS